MAPNILWLVTDQQMCANRPAVTRQLPLQRFLAHRGTRFNKAYTALPICSPARATMLTGRYPHNHGLTENDGRFGGRAGLDPGDRMIQHAFSKAGYRCGHFGKWHLNNDLPATDFAFEGYGPPGYGYPYGSARYSEYLEKHGLPNPTCRIELSGESNTPPGTIIDLAEQVDWFDFEAGSAILTSPAETHEAFFVADMAIDWLEQVDDAPFFLRVDTWGPHPPYTVATPFDTMFADLPTMASSNIDFDLRGRPQHHRDYLNYWQSKLGRENRNAAMLSRRALQQAAMCETALLRVVMHLASAGQLDNTLVVYCADHGDAVASNGGMLNKGGLMVEETLRIPLIFAGPGVQKNISSDTLVMNADISPTLTSAAELPDFPNDGQDLFFLLSRNEPLSRTGIMTQHNGLHVPLCQRSWHQGDWKYMIQADGFEELYDLRNDPTERQNLATDVSHKDQLQSLRCALSEEMRRTNDPSITLTQG